MQGRSREGRRQGGRVWSAPSGIHTLQGLQAQRTHGPCGRDHAPWGSKTSAEQSSIQGCQRGQQSCFLETWVRQQIRKSRRSSGWKEAGGTQKPSTAVVDVRRPRSVRSLHSHGGRYRRQQNRQPLKSCPCLGCVLETDLPVPKPQSKDASPRCLRPWQPETPRDSPKITETAPSSSDSKLKNTGSSAQADCVTERNSYKHKSGDQPGICGKTETHQGQRPLCRPSCA